MSADAFDLAMDKERQSVTALLSALRQAVKFDGLKLPDDVRAAYDRWQDASTESLAAGRAYLASIPVTQRAA